MKKPRVIAFLARAGNGKSTAAKYVADNYGGEVVSFAGPLKRLAERLLPWEKEQLYGSSEDKERVDSRFGMSAREFMQRLGEGARQELDPLVWSKAAIHYIEQQYRQNPVKDLFIVDDCRYINEVKLLKKEHRIFCHVIKLVYPDATAASDLTHPSEAQVDQVPPQYISQTIIHKTSPEAQDLKNRLDASLGALFPQHKKSEHFATSPAVIP